MVQPAGLSQRRPGQPVQRRPATDPGCGQHPGQVQHQLRVDVRAARRTTEFDQSPKRLGQALLVGGEVLLIRHPTSLPHPSPNDQASSDQQDRRTCPLSHRPAVRGSAVAG